MRVAVSSRNLGKKTRGDEAEKLTKQKGWASRKNRQWARRALPLDSRLLGADFLWWWLLFHRHVFVLSHALVIVLRGGGWLGGGRWAARRLVTNNEKQFQVTGLKMGRNNKEEPRPKTWQPQSAGGRKIPWYRTYRDHIRGNGEDG